MALDLFDGYEPHKHQIALHKSQARFKNLAAGTRGGKTFGAARDFVRRIMDDKRNMGFVEIKGKRKRTLYNCHGLIVDFLHYWAVAPNYPIGKVQWREFISALGGEKSKLIKKINKSERYVMLKGNVLVEFKSAEHPENLVGVGLNGLWCDEAARLKPAAWPNLRARLSDKQGWGLFSTTPMGKNWYYEDIFRLGDPLDEKHDPEFENFVFKTVDNTALPGIKEEVERARKQMPPKYFRRDYEASFEAFDGQVYETFDRNVHLVRMTLKNAKVKLWEVEHLDGTKRFVVFRKYIGGMDHGYNDPAVLLVFGCTGEEYYGVAESFVTKKRVLVVDSEGNLGDCLVKRYVELHERFPMSEIWADPSRPEHIQTYQSYGLSVIAADNAIDPGIQLVDSLYYVKADTGRPNLHLCWDMPNTVRETEVYKYKENRHGVIKEEPEDKDNHTQDSKRYALYNDAKQSGSSFYVAAMNREAG